MISHKQLSTNSEKRGNFELFFEGLRTPKKNAPRTAIRGACKSSVLSQIKKTFKCRTKIPRKKRF